jgi:hypothetical protein
VIDNAGRAAARKGWEDLTTSGSHAAATESIFEYIESATARQVISAGGGKIYSGTTTLTDVTGALTPSNDDWLFLNYNGKCVGVQGGETAIVKTGAGNFAAIAAATGTVPSGNAGLSAFGRLWITSSDEITIQYCDSLKETEWDNAGSGAIDTSNVWPDGLDKVMALAEFQNRLIVFGRRSILIYTGADDPKNSLVLEDIIVSGGTVSRDSVVHTGNDLLYLARDGLASLQRGIQFSTLPLQALSDTVRADITTDIAQASTSIKCCYSRDEGALLCKIGQTYYYFDVRRPLETGDLIASKWTDIGYQSLHYSEVDGTLYLGQTGVVAKYAGYTDDGASYRLRLRTPWLEPAQGGVTFIPKSALLTVITRGGYNVSLGRAFDFDEAFRFEQKGLSASETASEWNVAKWSGDEAQQPTPVAEWSGAGNRVKQLRFDLGGEGERMALELTLLVDGFAFSLQQIILLGLLGRIAA